MALRVALVDDVATTGATLAAATGGASGRGSPHRALVRHSVGRVNERVGFARWQMRGLLLFVLAFANLNDIWSPDVLPNALFAWTVVNEGDVDYDEFVSGPASSRARSAYYGEQPAHDLDSEAYFFRACGESTATEPPASDAQSGRSACARVRTIVSARSSRRASAFLAFPFFAPFVLAGADPLNLGLLVRVGHVAAATIEVIATLLLWSLMRRFVSARWALALVLLYFFGTSVRTIASQALWQHAGVHLAITFALWLVLSARPVALWRELAAGVALGFGAVVRQTTGLLVAVPSGVAHSRDGLRLRRGGDRCCCRCSSTTRSRSEIRSSRATGRSPSIRHRSSGSTGCCSRRAAASSSTSPTCSSRFATVVLLRPGREFLELRLLVLVYAWAATAILYATYAEWWGGRVFGPRFLDDLAPVLFALLAWGIGQGLLARAGPRASRSGSAPRGRCCIFQVAAFVYDQNTLGPESRRTSTSIRRASSTGATRSGSWCCGSLPEGGPRVIVAAGLSALALLFLLRVESVLPSPSVTTAFSVFFGRGGPSRDRAAARLHQDRDRRGRPRARRRRRLRPAHRRDRRRRRPRAAFARGGADVVAPRDRSVPLRRGARSRSRARAGSSACATIGAGAGALMSTAELTTLREEIDAGEALVLSNNYYSADLVAFTPASALIRHRSSGHRQPATAPAAPAGRALITAAGPLGGHAPRRRYAGRRRGPQATSRLSAGAADAGRLGRRARGTHRRAHASGDDAGARARRRGPRRRAGLVVSRVADGVSRAHARRRARHAGRGSRQLRRGAHGPRLPLPRDRARRRSSRASASSATGCSSTTRVLFAHLGWQPSAQDRFASDLFRPTRSRPASCARSPRRRVTRRSRFCSEATPSCRESCGRSSRRRGPVIPSVDAFGFSTTTSTPSAQTARSRWRSARAPCPCGPHGVSDHFPWRDKMRNDDDVLRYLDDAARLGLRVGLEYDIGVAPPLRATTRAALHYVIGAIHQLDVDGVRIGFDEAGAFLKGKRPSFSERERFVDDTLARRIRERMLEVVRRSVERDRDRHPRARHDVARSPPSAIPRSRIPRSGRSGSSSSASKPTSRSR